MKVLFPVEASSDLGSAVLHQKVCDSLGMASLFVILRPDGSASFVDNVAKGISAGGCGSVAQVKSLEIDGICAKGIGEHALESFVDHGLKVYQAGDGTLVDEFVTLLEGRGVAMTAGDACEHEGEDKCQHEDKL